MVVMSRMLQGQRGSVLSVGRVRSYSSEFHVNTTSAAVSGEPSLNVTFFLSLKVQTSPSSLVVQLSAMSGSISPVKGFSTVSPWNMRSVKSVVLVAPAVMGLKLLGSPSVARTNRPPYVPGTGLYCSLVTTGTPTFGPACCACTNPLTNTTVTATTNDLILSNMLAPIFVLDLRRLALWIEDVAQAVADEVQTQQSRHQQNTRKQQH